MRFFKRILVSILTLESRLILAKYKPFIIAVTGSVGKTSTKDAIYCVLKDHSRYVRKSEKSLNSDIGLPLTVIGMPNAWHSMAGWIRNISRGLRLIVRSEEYPDTLVLEVGADHPGDIKKVARWLHPDIAVITKVSSMPVHVEFFSSPEKVFEEKAALVDAVKDGGTLVVFADDQKTASLGEMVKGRGVKVLTFGIVNPATVRGFEEKIEYVGNTPTGFSFKLDIVGETMPVHVGHIVGKAYMYPLLAAAAVGKARDIPMADIVQSLNGYEAPKGRMNVIAGLNGSTIIDDSYNSSPDAVSVALEALRDLSCSGRKIAVLGDMLELGKYSAEQHHAIGREVASVLKPANGILVTVGQRSRATAEEAVKSGFRKEAVHEFDSAHEAAAYLVPIISAGDIALVKGSQSMRMERVVAALLREPSKAGELLVRQEREWLDKA